MAERLPLVAYRVSATPDLELAPAPVGRDWMAATSDGFASRCLPLLVANQAGWWLHCPQTLRLVWSGGRRLDDVSIEIEDGAPPACALSHFGHGIVTFTVPYLFRTPPGWNLLVRGPANLPKDGASPLEGLVETDWCPATFTMNWKLTRPSLEVRFMKGDPIAMLVPVRRGELEAFDPEARDLYADAQVAAEFRAWRQSRADFLRDLPVPGTDAHDEAWQRDYMHGARPDGTLFDGHQRKLQLRPWKR